MKVWLGYALTAAGLLAVLAGLVGWLLGPSAGSVWRSAGIAFVVQVVAFAVLLWSRRTREAFLAAWVGGILARLLVVGGVAFWVTRSNELEPAPTLLSLAGFLFVLLLLEPVFFLVGQRNG